MGLSTRPGIASAERGDREDLIRVGSARYSLYARAPGPVLSALRLGLGLTLLVIAFVSCELPTPAAPQGTAEVRDCAPVPDSLPAEFEVTVLVSNTGDLTISASHVTVSLTSSKREYTRSIHEPEVIVPGGSLVLLVEFAFLGEEETLAADVGAKIVSAYFE